MKAKANVVIIDTSELDAVSRDMRKLYDDFLNNESVKREAADTAANIAGKNLKAQQLKIAAIMYNHEVTNKIGRLVGDSPAGYIASNA